MQPSLLTADNLSLSVSAVLAAILAGNPGPATRILQRFSGTTLTIPEFETGERDLTPEEQFRLGAGPIACRWRTGNQVTGTGLIAAVTSLTWIPGRLPDGISDTLTTSTTPAGIILEPFDMRRTDRQAMAVTPAMCPPASEDDAVISSAVLVVRGQQAAIACERISREFAESLA